MGQVRGRNFKISDLIIMRIGIDARFLGPKGKGLGRYTQKLIENLEKIDSQNQYVIFLRKENWDEYEPKSLRFKKVLADYRWYSLAEQIAMPSKIYREKVDLMHFPHFNVPVFYFGPFVVTIHDLILRRFPTRRASTLNPPIYLLKNFAYRLVIWLAIKRAKKIIAVSNYTKDDILRFFKVKPEKIEVIYEGTTQLAWRNSFVANSKILEKYKIGKPYLLYVGNAYPHKNLERLIEAFKILIRTYQKNLQLVLVGEEDYFYRRLKKLVSIVFESPREKQEIIFTDFVSDEELTDLYQNAALYVFSSLCEGFGLPPLEAMAHGIPVVSSCATCLPEVLGDAAVYFDAGSAQDIAEKINNVLGDKSLTEKLIAAGYEQIKKYSWRKMAEEMLETYRGIKN